MSRGLAFAFNQENIKSFAQKTLNRLHYDFVFKGFNMIKGRKKFIWEKLQC